MKEKIKEKVDKIFKKWDGETDFTQFNDDSFIGIDFTKAIKNAIEFTIREETSKQYEQKIKDRIEELEEEYEYAGHCELDNIEIRGAIKELEALLQAKVQ